MQWMDQIAFVQDQRIMKMANLFVNICKTSQMATKRMPDEIKGKEVKSAECNWRIFSEKFSLRTNESREGKL